MDRVWWAAVQRVAKNRTQLKRLNTHTHTYGLASLCKISLGGSESKESACNAGDLGSILEGNGSILTWRIPWTEEPGQLQSMGSQRVRHD